MGNTDPERIEATFYARDGDAYVCGLCPNRCRISVGKYGRCGSRYGDTDQLTACTYGMVSAICMDPIEKKPLYHFYPGERILSVGGVGCNMSCRHCQNHHISQPGNTPVYTETIRPQDIPEICLDEGTGLVAFTYNEPGIWFEYIRDTVRYGPDLRYVLVTNGLIENGPLLELCDIIDAMNIDIKGFTEGFYTDICGAHLSDVLRTAETVFRKNVHLELTYLIIPGYNDTDDELISFSEWVAKGLSADIPVHFSRFHPDHEMCDVPATSVRTMRRAYSIAKEHGLKNVYLGNVDIDIGRDTFCPNCGSAVISRSGYRTDCGDLDGICCGHCGHELYLIR